MHLETFAHGHSLAHRLDPRAKLAATLAFSLVVALGRGLALQEAGLALGLACVLAARLDPVQVLKRLLAVNAFVVLLWVVLPWQIREGSVWWHPAFEFSERGLMMARAITLKTNAVVLCLIGLVSTSPVNQVFHALAHWRVPMKILQIFFFFYRYLHVLHQEYHRLDWGLKVRGFAPRSNWHTYRTYAQLLGMLLVRSFDRAERVYQAMLCRGFNGTYWVLDHFAWQRRDGYFLAGWGLALLGLVGLAWMRP